MNPPKPQRNASCPCGSGEKAKRCCLTANNNWLKVTANLTPPRPVTGFSHPNCFAASTRDCSPKISLEHFISRGLLTQLNNNSAIIAGLAWQPKAKFNRIGINSLASKVLCVRHNTALSSLDGPVIRLSQALEDFDDALANETSVINTELRLFSGEDIERWILKAIIGAVQSKNLTSVLPGDLTNILFGIQPWPTDWGLYLEMRVTNPIYHSDSFRLETLIDSVNIIKGVRFIIRGLPFVLALGRPDDQKTFLHRPRRIVLETGLSKRFVELSWADSKHTAWVRLKRAGAYAGYPADWAEWEKQTIA